MTYAEDRCDLLRTHPKSGKNGLYGHAMQHSFSFFFYEQVVIQSRSYILAAINLLISGHHSLVFTLNLPLGTDWPYPISLLTPVGCWQTDRGAGGWCFYAWPLFWKGQVMCVLGTGNRTASGKEGGQFCHSASLPSPAVASNHIYTFIQAHLVIGTHRNTHVHTNSHKHTRVALSLITPTA